MKQFIDHVKELSDKEIEKIIQSRYNVQIDTNNYHKESIYIKEALQNMIKLDILDNHDGMIISCDWILPDIDYDNEKIIYEKKLEIFYFDFDSIEKYPKEKWYEHRFSIEGMVWNKVLGSYCYYENESYECIEMIIHEMVAFGNNADECKIHFDEYCRKVDKRLQDIKDGKEKTYTIEEFCEYFDKKHGVDLERQKHDIIFEKMKNEYYQALKQCMIQNNNHLVKIVEKYNNQINQHFKN